MNEISEYTAAIVEDLWQRFRLLAMVIARTDSFVGITPAAATIENLFSFEGVSWIVKRFFQNDISKSRPKIWSNTRSTNL